MGRSKRLSFSILLHFGLEIYLSEMEIHCSERTQDCYDTQYAMGTTLQGGTHSPQVQLTNLRMCTYHKWLPPRQNLTIPGAGREDTEGCPSSSQPCQASCPAGLYHCLHMRPCTLTTRHGKAENHTNQRMLGLCKRLWDYERYTQSKPMNYSKSHWWLYSSAAQMDLVLMVWKLW